MQPADSNPMNRGSPSTKLCSNSEMLGTALEQLSATNINTTKDESMPISTGPVPLFLVAKRIFTEIQAHGGYISDIAIHRTAYHTYCITLTKTPKPGCNQRQGQEQKQELNKNQGGANAA